MNEIAVIEQLPIITEQIKMIGEKLDKRLESLNLDNLVCNEETKREIKDLKATLGKELKEFEMQRKNIKTKIMEPYEIFNKTYEEQIKTKYENADEVLKNKINEVESAIKHNAEVKMKEYFEECKKSKSIIQDSYLEFHELNIKIDLSCLTKTGVLAKKVKDEINQKVDEFEKDIKTISTMENKDEILVEYLKNKDLSLAIKEVNDRYFALDALKRIEESAKETVELEEKGIEKVEEVLSAPIEGQMSIDDFEGKLTEDEFLEERKKYIEDISSEDDEVVQVKFVATGKRKDLREIVDLMKERGVIYESITN